MESIGAWTRCATALGRAAAGARLAIEAMATRGPLPSTGDTSRSVRGAPAHGPAGTNTHGSVLGAMSGPF